MTITAAAFTSLVILSSLGLAEAAQAKERAIIGDATMTEDRTIVVRLRRTADGINVSGVVKYSVNDPHYSDVLNHLGGMNPGETKLVPAWDDAGPEKK
jgi:hypothetical protein